MILEGNIIFMMNAVFIFRDMINPLVTYELLVNGSSGNLETENW